MKFDLRVLSDPDTDPAAHQREWRRLFSHFTPRLESYYSTRVPSADEREDLIQHIWYKAILHIDALPDASVLWNWLRRVGDNRITDLRRSDTVAERHAAEHSAEVRHEMAASPAPSALDLLASNPFEGDVGRRFATLSDLDRKLVMLAIDNVPHEEIARQLGLPTAAASRQRWHRLRHSFRRS